MKNQKETASSTPAIMPPTRAARSFADIANELDVGEYVKAGALATMGMFNIIGAHSRRERGEFQEQCEYEIQLLEGENCGARALLTLTATPVRRALVDSVRKYGSIGPVVLKTQEGQSAAGLNQPWVFVEPEVPTLADSKK